MLKLQSLTSFRFVAALMVYLSHSISIFHDYQTGYVGVSFFFVLSGFILVYNYQSKFTELNKVNLKKFYIARIAKIYPVHLLTLGLSIPYLLIKYFLFDHPHPDFTDFISGLFANLFMVQSFIPLPFGTIPYTFNPVSWSLSDELFFYALFPFILYALLKLKISKRVSTNVCAALLFFVAVIGIVLISATIRGVKMDDWFFYVFPVFRCFDFMMGMIIGMIFVTMQQKEYMVNKSLFTFLELLALILLIGWIAFSPHVSQAFRFSVYYFPLWCSLIFIFAFQGGLVSKILSHKWLVYLGEISFSFYMVHLLVVNYVGLVPMANLFNHLATFAGSVLMAALIYEKYEEPLRKKIRFRLRKEKTTLEYKTV